MSIEKSADVLLYIHIDLCDQAIEIFLRQLRKQEIPLFFTSHER